MTGLLDHTPKDIRAALVIGPVLACVGIAWTAIAPSDLSSAAILIGFATAVWGTHKYGRLGVDVEDEGSTKSGTDTSA